jgi:hypothetical protein
MPLKLKELIHPRWTGGEKTRGEKMKVSLIMLLKTYGEKLSVFRPAIMLLKIS